MVFWFVAGAAALIVAASVWLATTRRGQDGVAPTAAYDLEIYRDQMKELDRDVARGLIGEAEAERAKIEISRRILAADKALAQVEDAAGGGTEPIILFLAAVILGAFGLYAWIGIPGYPDMPFEARIAAIEAARDARPDQETAEAEIGAARPPADLPEDVMAELSALRQRMEREPEDTEGWLTLAQFEAQANNFTAARRAQERAIALLGDDLNAAVFLDFARLHILAAGGYVSPEAEDALERAHEMAPENADARFLLGASYARTERPDLAFALWHDLLRDSEPDDPWVPPILEQIEVLATVAGQRIDPDVIERFSRGPTRADVEAMSQLSREEQLERIEGMVGGLADRLAAQGGDAEEWAQLIGALVVLDRLDEAQAVYDEATTIFAGDSAALRMFAEAGAVLLLEPEE